jgi:hypothetical protein
MLTGKNKERFEEWLQKELKDDRILWEVCNLHGFVDLSESMQWGFIQDYADSIGYMVNVYCNASGYLYEMHRNSNEGGTHLKDSGFEADTEHGAWYTMDEARKAAIKAFDEIANSELR